LKERYLKKQSQFGDAQNERNASPSKELQKQPRFRSPGKRSQFKANLMRAGMMIYHSCPASQCGINSGKKPDFFIVLDSASSAE